MFLITAGFAAVVLAQAGGVSIPIHNVSARYVALQLAQKADVDFAAGVETSLAPGVRIFLDPARNGLLVRGAEQAVGDLKRVVELFDIKPLGVRMEVTGSVPEIGFENVSDVTVSNNASFSFRNLQADLAVSVTPRINGDGTVTTFFDLERQGLKITTVIRSQSGQRIRVVVNPDGTVDGRTDEDIRFDRTVPRVTPGAAVIYVRPTVQVAARTSK